MTDDSLDKATREGIEAAWSFRLSHLPFNVVIMTAIQRSLDSWLEQHSQEIIDAIAKQHDPKN